MFYIVSLALGSSRHIMNVVEYVSYLVFYESTFVLSLISNKSGECARNRRRGNSWNCMRGNIWIPNRTTLDQSIVLSLLFAVDLLILNGVQIEYKYSFINIWLYSPIDNKMANMSCHEGVDRRIGK